MDASTAPASYDLIVAGSGIAGLYAALLAAPQRRVLVVTKGALQESNTRYAQGGIAAAMSAGDSPELHLRDTIAAGDGLCNTKQVAILTRDAPGCIEDLLRRGVPFDRSAGELAWTLEAAHSLPRVLHAGGDATGAAIERTLASALRESGVAVMENALCTGLRMDGRRVTGIDLLLDDGALVGVEAPAVILATGGAGRLYSRTTNPAVATGDGLAIAYRAGAELMDMEFVQFHPTALVVPGAPSFLISEAVRGEGGILRDVTGRAFMAEYHPDRELAPRDVVARAIHSQMARTGAEQVWLDITHLPRERVEERFPSIVAFCRAHGIDPVIDPIPVAPAAHYMMGGIRTDAWGRTSVPGLFACGEAACTGVHGANRLASNSLLEGLVFARRAVASLLREPVKAVMHEDTSTASRESIGRAGERGSKFRQTLGRIMWEHVSLVRSAESLQQARDAIRRVSAQPSPDAPGPREACEDENLTLVAELVIASATFRQESRGAHFRTDFPKSDASWRQHTVISRAGIRTAPVAEAEAASAAGSR